MDIINFTRLLPDYPVSIATNFDGSTVPLGTPTALVSPIVKMEGIKLKSAHKRFTTFQTTKPTRTTTHYHQFTIETMTMASSSLSSDVWVLDLTWDDATWLVK